MDLKVTTDFTGIGVPEMALEALGVPHTNVFACENDKFARISYLANFKPKVFYEDITKRNHKEVGPVDLYIAGFPCQAFSISGKRKGFADVRGTLFFDLASFIKTNKPKVFILENVKGLLSHDKPKNSKAPHGKTFNTIINLLAKTVNGQYAFPFYTDNLGYHVYYKVLNSKHYGVPQNRERIFIIGFRDDDHTFTFPKETILQTRIKDILEDEVDEKFYLSDNQVKSLTNGFQKSPINPEIAPSLQSPRHSCGNYRGMTMILRWQNSKDGVAADEIAPSLKASGGTDIRKRALVAEVKQLNPSKESNGAQPYQQNRVYDPEGIAPAIPAQLNGDRMHNVIIPEASKKSYTVAASRGRGENCEQQLEIRKDGLTNSITSVEKDNLLIITEASKNGYAIAEEGDAIDLKFIGSKTRRGRISKGIAHTVEGQMQQYTIIKKKYGKHQQDAVFDSDGISPTLQSSGDGHIGGASAGYLKYLVGSRIRCLTPLECFRLQDIPDKMYHNCKNAGLSDTQLYKQAGNAMTRSVMMALIKKVLPNFKPVISGA